jgi:hypothetical protein
MPSEPIPPMFVGNPVRVESGAPSVQAKFLIAWDGLLRATEPGVHRPCHCAGCDVRRIFRSIPRRRGMSASFSWLLWRKPHAE